MTDPTDTPIEILGPIFNFTEEEGSTPLAQSHQAGLTFVAMDAGAYGEFRGGARTGEWVVSRKLAGPTPELDGWPNTGWRFQDQAKAAAAYQAMRAHVVSKLPAAKAAKDKSPERRLNDPETALAEAFTVDGEEVLFLSCDQATEARILEMLTDRLEPYTTQGTKQRYASYSSQVSAHLLGIALGEGDVAEHVVAAFTPGEEEALIAEGLVESVREGDLKPFNLDVPSGILIVAWGRLDGKALIAAAGAGPAGQVVGKLLEDNIAGQLDTPLDEGAPGPLVWAIRVRPGTYGCALRWLETEQGISAMALSHLEAEALWPDQIPARAPARPAPIAAPTAATTAAAQAAAANLRSGGGGDPDPIVFPGQKLAKLSDYVKLMKGMQSGDMMGALSRAGLDMAAYGSAAAAWGQKMATDPTLTAKFAAMMAKA